MRWTLGRHEGGGGLRRKWLFAVAGVLLLVALVAYAAIFTKFLDPAEYDSFDAEDVVPSAIHGAYVSVAGTIVGLETGEDDSEHWSGELHVDGGRGHLVTLSFNGRARFEFPPQSRPASGTPAATSAFPHEVLGFRFKGRAKVVHSGLLGLFRHTVLVDGQFIHPGG